MIFNSIDKNNFEKEHISVEIAGENNIQDILEIQKERLLSDKQNVGELMESGFLVNPISESDIIEAINNSNNSYIFVAKNKIGEIVGYSLSYDFLHFLEKHPKWKKEVGDLSIDLEKEKVVYGKHLASRGNISGVGTAINNNLFKFSKDKGYTLYIGEICEGPIKNSRSADFHTNNFGLNKVGAYKDTNQYDWGIYAKKL
ncbi:hypothetical protein IPN41_03350 [Candidatus Falkowbacteria bacterium]|nr:MAG: hypothetical protein IPN41_03350 [Candidatus Falkowbacteria bacterium]